MIYAAIALVAYLLGSVPFGLLIGLSRGIDVRKVGSRNIGATNVLRTVGKPWGALAFLLDFAKGFAGAALVPCLARMVPGLGSGDPTLEMLAGGLGAVAGHTWPVWLRFKGGKGVATSAGMLAAIAPTAVGAALLVWLAVFLTSRYVSLASISAATFLAVAIWFRPFAANGGGTVLPVLVSLLGALVVYRHKGNIARLLTGTENRFKF